MVVSVWLTCGHLIFVVGSLYILNFNSTVLLVVSSFQINMLQQINILVV
jgi:hypothetical protein